MRRMRPGFSTVETVVAVAIALFLVSAALVFVFGVTRHIARTHAEFVLAEKMRETRDRLIFRSVPREIEFSRNELNEFYGGLASARSVEDQDPFTGVIRYKPVGVYFDRDDHERNGESCEMLPQDTTNYFGDVTVAVRRTADDSLRAKNLVLADIVGERLVGGLFVVRRRQRVFIPVFGTEQLPDLPADEPILPEDKPDWLSDESEGGAP